MLRRRARRGATRRRRRARRAPAAALRSGRTQRTSCGRACSSYSRACPRGRLPRGSAFRRPRARSAGTLPRRARSRSCWRRAHVATITFKERGSLEFNERSMFSTDARGFFAAAIKLFSQVGFPMDAERIRGMMADAVNARLPVDGWRAQVPAEVPAPQPERSRVRGCQVVSITVSVRSVTVSRRHVPLQKKDTPRAVLCARTPRDTARMDHHEQVVAQRRVALDREEDGGDGAFLGWPPRAQIPAPWTPARRAGKCIAKRTSRAR